MYRVISCLFVCLFLLAGENFGNTFYVEDSQLRINNDVSDTVEYPFDKLYIIEFNYAFDEESENPEWLYRVYGFSSLDNKSNLTFAKRLWWDNPNYYESNIIIPRSTAVVVADVMRNYTTDSAFLYPGELDARICDGNAYAFVIQNKGKKNVVIKFEPRYLPDDLKQVYNYLYNEEQHTKREDDYKQLFNEFEEIVSVGLLPLPFLKETIEFVPPILTADICDIVNAYIEDVNSESRRSNIAVIYEKTIPLVSEFFLETEDGELIPMPSPSGYKIIEKTYDIDSRKILEGNILTSEEVEFMKMQIQSHDTPLDELFFDMLDPACISQPIITESEYKDLFQSKDLNKNWKSFNSKYKGCLLSFSNLLFNKDKSKVYFQISSSCALRAGHGELVVMEKTDEGWKVIYKKMTWIS